MKTIEHHLAWDIVISVTATLAAVIIPFKLAVKLFHQPELLYLDWIFTILFAGDIVIHFVHGRHHGSSIPGHAEEERHYGIYWLAIDLVAAFPFGALSPASPLQLLRLIKLARLAQFMHEWRQNELKQANALRLVFFLYWFALSAHVISCGWLALRGFVQGNDRWTSYVQAAYWCVTTLSTVGYGDVTPSTNGQRLYAMLVMIFGVGVYGYIIGNVASLLANIDPARANYVENMERLSSFMSYRNLPPALRQRIRHYYAYLWEKRLGYDEADIVDALPPNLKTEVSLFLKRDIIEKVPVFRGASDDFIKEIALHMRPLVFTPGDFVFKAGEQGREMYFISRGRLEVLSKDGASIYATMTDGDFFGEIALFTSQPRTASVRAVDYCDLYSLDKEMFDRVLSKYPEVATQIEARAKERVENVRTV